MNSNRLLLAETLIAVIDTGGFSSAADSLGVSQSTVSRRIAALEKKLGGKMLLRR
ncbi:MAG TPA: LysR family transcriptional regulator, partial [Gammaproteobacteria bacterium]|nr:LysR family transcriptional regulator [Gammaproteobacteria bacterium]